jgi:hypothetical protein
MGRTDLLVGADDVGKDRVVEVTTLSIGSAESMTGTPDGRIKYRPLSALGRPGGRFAGLRGVR